MSAPQHLPDRPAEREAPPPPRLGISLTQVIATALAAITATVAASFLGVTGTVVGAAVASVMSVVGTAVYGHSLRRTRDRVREAVPVRFAASSGSRTVAHHPGDLEAPVLPTRPPRGWSEPALHLARPPGGAGRAVPPLPAGRTPWRRFALGAVALFAAVLAVVTGVELVAGQPISDLVRGDAGSGTTLFGGAHGPKQPDPTRSGTRPHGSGGASSTAPATTPTVTETAPGTTETVTRTSSGSASPSSSPTSPTTSVPSSSSTPPDSGTPSDTGVSSQSTSL